MFFLYLLCYVSRHGGSTDIHTVNQATASTFSTVPTATTEWLVEYAGVRSNITTFSEVQGGATVVNLETSTTGEDLPIPFGAISVYLKLDCSATSTGRLNGLFHFKSSNGDVIYTSINPDGYCDSLAEAPDIQEINIDLRGIYTTTVDGAALTASLASATYLILDAQGASSGAHGPVTFTYKFTTLSPDSLCPHLQAGLGASTINMDSCDSTKCTSAGSDCCAPQGISEAATCSNGLTPIRTGVGCYGHAEGTYTCCTQTSDQEDLTSSWSSVGTGLTGTGDQLETVIVPCVMNDAVRLEKIDISNIQVSKPKV